MNIVVTGSIAYDYLMSFQGRFLEHIKPERLQKLSLSFLVEDMRKQRGGCAANIAFTLGLLGERPVLMGTAGQDFGDYRAWLEEHNVDTSEVKVIPDVFTASFFANTDLEQNQIASFYAGAMSYARTLSFETLDLSVDLTIISPNDPEAMVKYPLECRDLGIPYIYDPGQQVVRMDGAVLREGFEGAAVLMVNDYEYELLKDATEMTDEEMRAAVTDALIVTRGEEGSLIWADEKYHVPAAPPEQILDPTGVGDAFRAGLMKGLALDLPWPVCGRIGSLAATYVLETEAPQSHTFTLDVFVARYVTAFGEDAFTRAVA